MTKVVKLALDVVSDDVFCSGLQIEVRAEDIKRRRREA